MIHKSGLKIEGLSEVPGSMYERMFAAIHFNSELGSSGILYGHESPLQISPFNGELEIADQSRFNLSLGRKFSIESLSAFMQGSEVTDRIAGYCVEAGVRWVYIYPSTNMMTHKFGVNTVLVSPYGEQKDGDGLQDIVLRLNPNMSRKVLYSDLMPGEIICPNAVGVRVEPNGPGMSVTTPIGFVGVKDYPLRCAELSVFSYSGQIPNNSQFAMMMQGVQYAAMSLMCERADL